MLRLGCDAGYSRYRPALPARKSEPKGLAKQGPDPVIYISSLVVTYIRQLVRCGGLRAAERRRVIRLPPLVRIKRGAGGKGERGCPLPGGV